MNDNNIDFSKELLKPENMLRLYAKGAFPMADEDTGLISWYMPETRCIIPLDRFNIPRSLKKIIKENNFEFRLDTDLISTIRSCANREKTWISEKLIDAYQGLYKKGHVHSIETWKENNMVGGLYGISYKGAFFGESMFSKISQASKAALIKLLFHLKEKDYILLDVQFMTEHLKMFGAIEIPFEKYQTLLELAYKMECIF
jgi:leucyl/phenylalanyl-tRNA--protein transferase